MKGRFLPSEGFLRLQFLCVLEIFSLYNVFILWQVLKKATMRKEQEPDFEEKRFTVTIGEDEREFDKENEFFRDWNYCITRDVRGPA